jgi:regulation of enolase protein 1 (concanavalin A-like superfamily)
MIKGDGVISFGIYACRLEDSSFKATFTNFEITECKWLAHNGQKPDKY